AVLREEHGGAEDPDPLLVARIDADLAVVGRSRVRRRRLRERLALVVRSIDAAFLRVLDRDVDDPRIAPVDRDADPADVAVGGKALREPLPGGAAVRRLPQPAARSAPVVAERSTAALVGRRVERLPALRGPGHGPAAPVL